MKGYWRNLLLKTAGWLIAETILNLVGLDNLADYSEFILARHSSAEAAEAYNVAIALALPNESHLFSILPSHE
ncbi:MAG: hypothetical protein IGR93_00510 [Hydrococcus sp. C42_A2020_068]|uniref:hypothetical protein n=1 Tax=Pleurocapsa sp. PCC 7327 TaxID=118163 RepID=UPI00029FC54D|nr:hypothetical protein [Pleurocapsa sp. PCC 7327]AFY78678.1 hypothetical protein Ple7327_3472 [Pleurocapsa sp. PCC 7327]MBF2018615.1 hypothetical protein [Hydrococcus sp. C42_A2020_068]